ncbi:MAG: hypothetical protein ABIX44_09845 [Cryobacterium sp.]
MTNLPPATPTRSMPEADTALYSTQMIQPASVPQPTRPAQPETTAQEPTQSDSPAAAPAATAAPAAPADSTRRPAGAGSLRTALVVLAAMGILALAFIVMIFVGVSSASINALAVIVTPIATMVAAYYAITMSIQQVRNERAEKNKAMARADAADSASRETELWAAQMESGLRVAMAKLNAAHVNTDEVTKAAGTPDDFF